ncbi:phosphoribosyl-AMP cyclohydrolase (PRA-CH) / phosphoribosyl-ATP pyrophosphatase (PRA-PH) [Legionella lansingensis]|uniref:Histidine biosynthesis bifunctional protein HisIE n=1 Tax=Legionella lansingensis TaxID=45067 RepID=A0A0W0VGQ4_9GAMM|nr:bifunctional phosphoribosyl-AMP cyclohydrolase/phosphoribosyl-ATP diphosphatase HisIE [Legionella lansingensis]KTD19331.1 phosphoribosyl-ATP pyrophosphatase [Legionella lansingensis]SNV50376.1 phosphoribosyl-AMP cyclohydrolase (PRA-CH) / phosphoribosyl-ATP pyrophosphatase (PRA-PH) [Legionella lansingensis]
MNSAQLTNLDWQKMNGLIPAIIQDSNTGNVLMLGYMNQEALGITLETKQLTFYSRSKGRLWRKGETSGNTMFVESIATDCDGDSLLIHVKPKGPTCHLGFQSCFQVTTTAKLSFLQALIELILQRSVEKTKDSYTTQLLTSGIERCAQKVGEEAVETVIAALTQNQNELINESADLLYHLLVLLQACEVSFYEVLECLQKRHTNDC